MGIISLANLRYTAESRFGLEGFVPEVTMPRVTIKASSEVVTYNEKR